MSIELSPIEEWQADFRKEPKTALDNLLFRRVYMGQLHRNDTADIIYSLFHDGSKEEIQSLDQAMKAWFGEHLTKTPSSISASSWAMTLRSAFLAVDYFHLRETCDWLLDSYVRVRPYLRSLYLNTARDPETYLLRTLALHQKDQRLMPVWMRLCGLEEELPFHYASLGILGLRKLPDKNGEPHGDIHPSVFRGIVRLAEAIEKQGHDKTERRKIWERKCRGIMAMYPRSVQYWREHFLPLFEGNQDSIALKWLGRIIPELPNKIIKQLQNRNHQAHSTQPPSYQEFSKIKRLVERQPLNKIRTELDGFLDRNRRYTRQTGDTKDFVRTFCNFANKLLKQDSDLSLGLVEEAHLWEPYNPFTWTTLAKIEKKRENYGRALSLLWEAKRKFPEDANIRTSLADLLKRMGKLKIAETIYRQAMTDFPEDAVCRTGLAEVLKERGNLEEAEEVYRQAMIDFPKDAVCCTGLADVLWMRHQDSEAISLLEETLERFPRDIDKTLLDMVRRGPYDPDFLKKYGLKKKQDTIDFDWAGFQDPEFETGLCGLYRQTGCQEEGKLDKVLTGHPGYLPAILEKGWWLAGRSTEETGKFFSSQLKQHPHVLGLHLGRLRSKSLTGEKVDEQVWNDLTRDFSSRSTVIKLEHVRQELPSGNGTRLGALEKLRKQLLHPSDQLPASVRNNEEWLRGTVRRTLFNNINLDKEFKEEILPQVTESFQEHEIRLKGMVEQCVNII